MMNKQNSQGFTLVEMIIVIVITGIIGGMVAMFLRMPVQGYVDSARRAEMSDIADTALRRISRDLRLALPNSVRVRNAAGNACNGAQACYLEFIPTLGGGRYRDAQSVAKVENTLDFGSADLSFEVLGAMPPGILAGDQIVVYNMGMPGADAYAGTNRRVVSAAPAGNVISITSAAPFPNDSCVSDLLTGFVVGGCRFQVVNTAVTYVCNPTAGNQTLTRWNGYAIPVGQPTALPGGTSSLIATNVTACAFTYASGISQRSGLVTMHLTITTQGESVNLYAATHVNNVP